MALATATEVQKAYLAYFGRPADPVGLTYWQTQELSVMKAGFAASAEYSTLYAGMNIQQQVQQVYQNVFGRDADAPGLLYWAGEMTAGRQTAATIADQMMNNALGVDITTINNRVTYANAFTAAVDTTAEIVGYSGTAAATAARAAVQPVTTDASLVTAQASVASSVSTVTAAGASSSGQTYTLTTGIDTLTGTSGNDTFVGEVTLTDVVTPVAGGSYNVADTLDGAAGVNTLTLTVSGGASTTVTTALPAATLTKIQGVSIRNATVGTATATLEDDGVSFDATGMSTLTNDRSVDYVSFLTAKDAATLNIKGNGTLTTAQGATAATFATGATSATVNFVNGTGTSGANDSGDVTIGSGLTSLAIGSTGAANAVGVVTTSAGTTTETVTIDASTNLTLAQLTGYSAAVTNAKLTIGGAGLTKITAALDATLDTLDASAGTGGINVILGGTGTTVTGSKGDDRVGLAALAITKNVTGGDGTDTVVFTNSTNYTTAAAKVSGFEVLDLSGNGAAYDVSLISGITGIKAQSAGNLTLTNVGATTPITVVNNLVGVLSVGLTSTTGTNTVSVTIDDEDTTAAAITVGAITAANVEILSLATGDTLASGTPHVVSALTGSTSLTTINVSGTSDLTITDATVPTAALTIDATGFTKILTVGAAATSGISAGDTVKGGSGADNLFINFASLGTTTSFLGGTGDDTLTVIGNGSDIVDGDFAAMTGVDNLVVTSATNTTVTLEGYAQTAIGTVDANSDGRLDITAASLTTGSTINASALITKGVDIAVTLTSGGVVASALSGGAVADTISFNNVSAQANTTSITGGAGIDVITLTGDATSIESIVITATSLVDSDLITGFTTTVDKIDYNGTLQAAAALQTLNADLNTALGTATRGGYIATTDVANSGTNTQGNAFANVLSASASTLSANFDALKTQLLATSGYLNGTFSNLDTAVANGSSTLLTLDNGTGSIVLRITNDTTVANTFTTDEIQLVAVATNAILVAADFI